MFLKRALVFALSLAFIVAPVGADAQQRNADAVLKTDSHDPLRIFNLSIGSAGNGNARACFSFKNLTAKNVTAAKFHFAILDQFGSSVLSANFVRNASSSWASGRTVQPPDASASGYSDTNDRSQSCWLFTGTKNQANELQSIGNGGHIEVTVTALSYAGGGTWQHGDTFARAFNYDGSAFVFTPEAIDASWFTEPDFAPLAVVGSSVRSFADLSNNAKVEQCVTFRNVTNKVATSVKFYYIFGDSDGKWIKSWWDTLNGTYTPPILIENKCWTDGLPSVTTVRRMRHEDVHVTNVTFSDGTTWSEGRPWAKAYDVSGNPVPGTPTVTPPASQAASSNSTPATPQNPVAPVTLTAAPNPGAPAPGSLQIGCTPKNGGNPVIITIDETNKIVATTAGPNYQEYGHQVTATGYFSATMISWTWPLTDRQGNVQQDSWTLNRSTLQADENHGSVLYQCARNQI